MRSSPSLAEAFVDKCTVERHRLIDELRSYEPLGVMRLWKGRSVDRLHEATDERVEALRRELAMIDAMIEFATTIGKIL